MNREPQSVEEFAELLSKEIKHSDYSVKEIFTKVGLPPAYLSRWKNKRDNLRAPYFYEVAQFSKLLSRPIEIFIYGMLDKTHVKIPMEDYEKMLAQIEEIVVEERLNISKRII